MDLHTVFVPTEIPSKTIIYGDHRIYLQHSYGVKGTHEYRQYAGLAAGVGGEMVPGITKVFSRRL